MNQKFKESYALLRNKMKGTNSTIMWTAGEMDDVSYIECWLVDGKGIVIFQVLKNGAGLNEYVVLTQSEKNASKMIQMIKYLVSCMKSNLSNVIQKEPEFEYYIKSGEELLEETTGVKPKA